MKYSIFTFVAFILWCLYSCANAPVPIASIASADAPEEFQPQAAEIGLAPRMSLKDVYKQYAANNDEFFDGKLPRDVTIDYEEHDDKNMATTDVWTDGTFHISLNPHYAVAERTTEYLLLHEECHVAVWDKTHNAKGISTENDHGPAWRACMLNIDAAGGFRRIMIDGYQEKMP
jgi:hypothetical protein